MTELLKVDVCSEETMEIFLWILYQDWVKERNLLRLGESLEDLSNIVEKMKDPIYIEIDKGVVE